MKTVAGIFFANEEGFFFFDVHVYNQMGLNCPIRKSSRMQTFSGVHNHLKFGMKHPKIKGKMKTSETNAIGALTTSLRTDLL